MLVLGVSAGAEAATIRSWNGANRRGGDLTEIVFRRGNDKASSGRFAGHQNQVRLEKSGLCRLAKVLRRDPAVPCNLRLGRPNGRMM